MGDQKSQKLGCDFCEYPIHLLIFYAAYETRTRSLSKRSDYFMVRWYKNRNPKDFPWHCPKCKRNLKPILKERYKGDGLDSASKEAKEQLVDFGNKLQKFVASEWRSGCDAEGFGDDECGVNILKTQMHTVLLHLANEKRLRCHRRYNFENSWMDPIFIKTNWLLVKYFIQRSNYSKKLPLGPE